MLTYDSRQLEQLAPFLAFVEALTKPEVLQQTVEHLRSENTKYQELLGAFKTIKLAETEAHRILDEAEAKAAKVREDITLAKIQADERTAKIEEQEVALSARKSALDELDKSLKERESKADSREKAALEKEIRNQTLEAKLNEWERSLRVQATELTEKAEKIKALVG